MSGSRPRAVVLAAEYKLAVLEDTRHQRLSVNLWLVRLTIVAVAAFTLCCLVFPAFATTPDEVAKQIEQDREILSHAGITPNADGAIHFLSRLHPTEQTRQTVTELIAKLGHDNYVSREKATDELEKLGIVAEAQLTKAWGNADLEVVKRVRRLLGLIQSTKESAAHNAVLSAIFRTLSRERHESSARMILRTIPLLERKGHFDEACVALWFAATREDIDRVRQATKQEDIALKTAAIPALEVAADESAVAELEPLLSHEVDQIRLATVRALIDRLPTKCVSVLLDLLESDSYTIKLQAAWLLNQIFANSADQDVDLQFAAQAKLWKQQAAELDASDWNIPLGAKRFQLSLYRVLYREEFVAGTANIKDRYGELRYETTVDGARASASQGVVRLHGDHNEGDQRLFITAEQLVGKDELKTAFVLTAEIGGESLGTGTYHVGISVGNLRVLFHPGYRYGGFRIERVDNHKYMLSNQRMTFTPAAGILHKMRVSVIPQQDKSVLLKTRIIDGENPNQTYEIEFRAQADDIGPINRVAIERSGRVGGAGLFGFFQVDTTGVDQ